VSLSEIEFVFFFPLLLILYWLVPRRAALQNVLLLLASVFFYATWNLRLLPLLAASTLIDWAVIRGFARAPAATDDADATTKTRVARRRRALLAIGLLNNLAALIWFKYVGFFAASLNELLGVVGIGAALPVLRVALPLGISFYTMGRTGVLLDTYYERIQPVRSLLVWSTFVAFFPQLTAGPIGRGSELFHQYEEARRPEPGRFTRALGELATGFVLKVYVSAHVASAWVDPVFAAPGTFTRGAHVLALIGYAVQVFGDFAGYSLIAIGVARLLGIDLPANFNFPFVSASPPEVWRRWHMTLNRWLFEYIYGPMVTGDGFMRGRVALGFIVVMLASGLWHGATWNFVLWGLLHGVWLLIHHRYDLFYKSLCRKAGWLVTIGFFVLTLVPFRASTLAGTAAFFDGLVVGGAQSVEAGTAHPAVALLLVIIYHVVSLPWLERLRERAASLPAAVRGFALGVSVVLLMLFAPVGAGTFIYAQF